MMKRTKTLLLFALAAALVIVSACQPEEEDGLLSKAALDDHAEGTQKEASQSSNDSFSALKWYHDGNGGEHFAGIGYNPLTGRVFPAAVDGADIYESTDVPQALKVDIEIIRTNRDLEKFVNKTDELEAKATLKTATVDFSRAQSLAGDLKISEETVTVAARISAQRYRDVTNPAPLLTSEAFELIETGKISEFVDTYGPMYVASQVSGGDFYYYYHYRAANFSKEEQQTFAQNAKANVEKMFGIENNVNLSSEQKTQISQALATEGVYSSVPGYTPSVVRDVADFQQEINNIQSFINQGKFQSSTMELTLQSWSNAIESQDLDDRYQTQIKCLQDLILWRELYAELQYYRNNVSDPERQTKLDQAIGAVQAEMNASEQCVGASTTSTGNEFLDLKKTDQDILKEIIAPQLTGVTTWAACERHHYLYPDEHSQDLWDPRESTTILQVLGCKWNVAANPLKFYWLKAEAPGALPLQVFQRKGQNIAYISNAEEADKIRHTKDWKYHGVPGYVLSSQKFNSIPLVRYFNSKIQSHKVVADAIQMADLDRDPEWRREGVLGYVFPSSNLED